MYVAAADTVSNRLVGDIQLSLMTGSDDPKLTICVLPQKRSWSHVRFEIYPSEWVKAQLEAAKAATAHSGQS